MAATASMRWGAFRSIGMAVRAATRPGSPSLVERLRAVPRLVGATVRGDYRARHAATGAPARRRPVRRLAAGPGARGDPAAGRVRDDAVVIAWIATALVNQTEGFLAWERQREQTVRGDVISLTRVR